MGPFLSSWGNPHEKKSGGCCCSDYQCLDNKANQPFSMSVGNASVVTLPCRTPGVVKGGLKLFAEIKPNQGTTELDWVQRGCEKYGLIDDQVIMKIEMGNVHDFFRPRWRIPLCGFFMTRVDYVWAPNRCGAFREPFYSSKYLGGSRARWLPEADVLGDHRPVISRWGSGTKRDAGCCCTDYTCTKRSWNLGFKVYLGDSKAVRKDCNSLEAIRAGFQLWADVKAKDDTSPHSWFRRGCDKVGVVGPSVVMKVQMGAVVDYFLPRKNMPLCLFLHSSSTFLWTNSKCG